MPRPITRSQLLAEIDKERPALEKQIASLTPGQIADPGTVGEWSVKDVLAHLIEWEQMVIGWVTAGQRGETPAVPAPGYKWSETPALNQHIYEKHRDRPLQEVLDQFHTSHRQILDLLLSLSDEDLTTPRRYPWTRDNALLTYFVSATSSHYRWARTEIRKGLKAKNG
jgi:hypothetical protein